MYPFETPRIQYTLYEMRADLVRRRDSDQPAPQLALGIGPFSRELFDRLISVIDAMTPIEREFANVLQISEARRRELASAAGVTTRGGGCLLAGRRAVEHTKNVYRRPENPPPQ